MRNLSIADLGMRILIESSISHGERRSKLIGKRICNQRKPGWAAAGFFCFLVLMVSKKVGFFRFLDSRPSLRWGRLCAGMTIRLLISNRYHKRPTREGGYPVITTALI